MSTKTITYKPMSADEWSGAVGDAEVALETMKRNGPDSPISRKEAADLLEVAAAMAALTESLS